MSTPEAPKTATLILALLIPRLRTSFLFLRGRRNDIFAAFSTMMPLEAPTTAVDLHQGTDRLAVRMVGVANAPNPSTPVFMPPLSKFKKFDVRPLLQKGKEPLPE